MAYEPLRFDDDGTLLEEPLGEVWRAHELPPAEDVRIRCVECGVTFRDLETYTAHVHTELGACGILLGAGSGAIVGFVLGIIVGRLWP